MKEIGIYVHIPFCKKKCYYCDFYSICAEDNNLIDEYFKTLNQEIEEVGVSAENVIVKTAYIGGGTPSSVDSKFIVELLNSLQSSFKFIENPEITIEVNPGTVTRSKLQDYYKSGINRLSIGMQSSSNELLQTIGRIHSWQEFLKTFENARDVGYRNINVDCMIGLPTQTLHDIVDTMNNIITLNPEHVSVYSLIVEDNTKLAEMLNKKELELPSEDVEREMYWKVKKILESNGYMQYEISNFSKPRLYVKA